MKGQIGIGVVGTIIAVVTFVILLPVVSTILKPTYTLNYAGNDSVTFPYTYTLTASGNDSVLFTDVGEVSTAQSANYPINGQLSLCANDTVIFTIPGQCNVSDSSAGTIQIVDVLSGGATINISYNYEYDTETVSYGQTDNYPINGQLTQCANDTDVLTVPTQCNVSTYSNGTVQVMRTLARDSTLNLRYYWEDARYLTNSTERSIASNIFIFVLIGLFILATAFMVR